jgi:ornithine cyclodeaminase/alanine dehydrogenase-like protein (mu-crystallin family)
MRRMSESLPYFNAETVHARLAYPRLIDALRVAFTRGVQSPVRHVHPIGSGVDRLLLMPAWREGEAIGVKLVTVFPGNVQRGAATVGATYVLLDGVTGHPVAVLDGEALTLRRTGAASALASTYLSRSDSRVLLVVGTGQLAPYMAHAHCAVRSIAQVLVWGRRSQAAQVLSEQLVAQGLPAAPVASLTEGLASADIVTCATTAGNPIVEGARVKAGTHIDLVGGFTPAMREADDALIARASVFVDTYAGALKEAGDLTQPLERGVISRQFIRAELATLARGEHAGRESASEVTLFKSVGTALEDLAAAELVLGNT